MRPLIIVTPPPLPHALLVTPYPHPHTNPSAYQDRKRKISLMDQWMDEGQTNGQRPS